MYKARAHQHWQQLQHSHPDALLHRGTFYIQYETLEELGEGAFGKAMKCRRRRDNQVFVVKIMHESKMSAKAIEEVCIDSLYAQQTSCSAYR